MNSPGSSASVFLFGVFFSVPQILRVVALDVGALKTGCSQNYGPFLVANHIAAILGTELGP